MELKICSVNTKKWLDQNYFRMSQNFGSACNYIFMNFFVKQINSKWSEISCFSFKKKINLLIFKNNMKYVKFIQLLTYWINIRQLLYVLGLGPGQGKASTDLSFWRLVRWKFGEGTWSRRRVFQNWRLHKNPFHH